MASFFSAFFYHIDGFLIFFYRLTGDAFANYIIGPICLAFFCVIIGEISVSLALRFNRRYFDEMNEEMMTKEKLSMQAYKAGDAAGYKALNKEDLEELLDDYYEERGWDKQSGIPETDEPKHLKLNDSGDESNS